MASLVQASPAHDGTTRAPHTWRQAGIRTPTLCPVVFARGCSIAPHSKRPRRVPRSGSPRSSRLAQSSPSAATPLRRRTPGGENGVAGSETGTDGAGADAGAGTADSTPTAAPPDPASGDADGTAAAGEAAQAGSHEASGVVVAGDGDDAEDGADNTSATGAVSVASASIRRFRSDVSVSHVPVRRRQRRCAHGRSHSCRFATATTTTTAAGHAILRSDGGARPSAADGTWCRRRCRGDDWPPLQR